MALPPPAGTQSTTVSLRLLPAGAGASSAWLALMLLSLLACPAPLQAGSVTAESIWDRRNARQMALQQVPRGSQVTRVSCTEIGLSMADWRYRCTVWYQSAPAPTPAPAAAPAAEPLPFPAPPAGPQPQP